MGKFRVRVKIQGFELEVDGDRQDIPSITSAVNRQLAGVLQSAQTLVSVDEVARKEDAVIIDAEVKPAKRLSRKRASSTKSNGDGGTNTLDFRHDSSKFGSPTQSWTVTQKCIWLLYVLEESDVAKEASSAQLTSTFDSQFKAAGKLHPPRVPRDLAAAKIKNPSPVGEDKGFWYLTVEGKRQAKELIAAVLGQA